MKKIGKLPEHNVCLTTGFFEYAIICAVITREGGQTKKKGNLE